MAILATLGVAAPEYLQYLFVNFAVLPFLAFTAFGYFCSRVLRNRAAIALAVATYVLSGIGLWNSAWFYFQEAFSLFFLLGTSLALLQMPSPRHLYAWLAALLVQLASLNYWTLYNLFFFLSIVGAYAITHWNQVVRCREGLRSWAASSPRTARVIAALVAIVMLVWTTLIATVMVEQDGNYFREIYSTDDAIARLVEMRRYTTELFNPVVERARQEYPVINTMHSARYIGIALLPLIVIGALAHTGRRGRWLLLSAALVLAACLATPFLLRAWRFIPMMDRIQHLFYFYSHHLQVVVVLLGALGLEVVAGPLAGATRRMAAWVSGACLALAAGVLATLARFSDQYPTSDINLEANLHAALILGLSSAVLLRALRTRGAREMKFAVTMLLLVSVVDLAWYFDRVSRTDRYFTETRESDGPWTGVRMTNESRRTLRQPWGPPRPELGFGAGLERYMPISNDFWPDNRWMTPWNFSVEEDLALRQRARLRPPFEFHASESAPISAPSGFSYRWHEWLYNRFRFEVTAPADGWLTVRQLYDPAWRVTVDGVEAEPRRATDFRMAVPLSKGVHQLVWDYRPLSRLIYWPAAFLLEGALAVLLTLVWIEGSSRFKTRRNEKGPRTAGP